MVWDKPRETLNRYDWMVLGHGDVIETGKLPSVRLDIPLPPTKDSLYRLAHLMAGLAEEFHAASQNPVHRSAVVEMRSVVRAKTLYFLQLKREWERDLRAEKEDAAARQELSGTARRTRLAFVPD